MAKAIELDVVKRDRVGKGAARAARREGMVPGVIYGDKQAPEAISINTRILQKQLETGSFTNTLYRLNYDGNSQRVIPRDVQLDPVRDFPLHVDFLRVKRDAKIDMEINVEFMNEDASPGLKAGGVLNVVRHAIEVSCPVEDIPESFEIDLTGKEVGDTIHGSDIKLPDGVEMTITDRDFTIATIAAPTVQAEPAEGEEAAEGEAAEAEAEAAEEEKKDDD